MLTCKACVFNQVNIDVQSKELQRQCTRNPPVMFMIPIAQGIVVKVCYPLITSEFMACGEYFDDDDDETSDEDQQSH